MRNQLQFSCNVHASPSECPDVFVSYSPEFDEYGLIVHDGGASSVSIHFCPWCGTKLPNSLRVRWFEELEALGFDDPMVQSIPEKYKSDAWYRAA